MKVLNVIFSPPIYVRATLTKLFVRPLLAGSHIFCRCYLFDYLILLIISQQLIIRFCASYERRNSVILNVNRLPLNTRKPME